MPSPMLTITKNLYDHRKPNATPMRSHIALRYKQTYFVIAGAKMITLEPILSSILPQANLPTPIR